MNRHIALAAVIAMALLGVISSGLRGAGTNAADEAAIRKLITAYDERGGNAKVPRLTDRYSGVAHTSGHS